MKVDKRIKWTEDRISRLVHAYSVGGTQGAMVEFPGMPAYLLRNTALRFGAKAPSNLPGKQPPLSAERIEDLKRRIENSVLEESAHDYPKQIIRPVGTWRADIPKVRSVFDLGAV